MKFPFNRSFRILLFAIGLYMNISLVCCQCPVELQAHRCQCLMESHVRVTGSLREMQHRNVSCKGSSMLEIPKFMLPFASTIRFL